jgi:hypothetical protein
MFGTPWGSRYGSGLGYISAPPAASQVPATQATPRKRTPLQNMLTGEDEGQYEPPEKYGERTGAKERPTSVQPEYGAPHDEPVSDYQRARGMSETGKDIGTGAAITGLIDPTMLSTAVALGNKIYGTAVARPAANKAFAPARGIGGEIPGQKPIGVLEDLLQWDFIFGDPFEQQQQRAMEANRQWSNLAAPGTQGLKSAPEVFGYEGRVDPQVDPRSQGLTFPNYATGPAPELEGQAGPDDYSYDFDDEYDDDYGA